MGFDVTLFALACGVVVASVGAVTGIGVAAHAYLRRAKRSVAEISPVDDQRLGHLEQAVDAIAIEVERISEGQRFMAKLQAERGRDLIAKS
jgi:hypothetical protein